MLRAALASARAALRRLRAAMIGSPRRFPFHGPLPQFLAFVGDAPLVAHNAGFDVAFINAELKRVAKPPIAIERVVDTLVLAPRKHPGGHNTLDDLCSRYRVDRDLNIYDHLHSPPQTSPKRSTSAVSNGAPAQGANGPPVSAVASASLAPLCIGCRDHARWCDVGPIPLVRVLFGKVSVAPESI
jgi:hypothetical protein